MCREWQLPEGVTLEQVTELAEEMERKRRREWNQKNPEKVEAQRIRTYQRFLTRHGYKVISPEGVTFGE